MNDMDKIRIDWQFDEVAELYDAPLMDLLYNAHTLHRSRFDPNIIQTSTLVSIKTGACPEDCTYCPQSARYKTEINIEKLWPKEKVIQFAKKAKESGSTRFCMGAAWRNPKQKDLTKVCELIQEVKKIGLQTCVTLGMLTLDQAQQLKEAGLDYYNHNIDTAPDFYPTIVTTRTFEDRLETIKNLRTAGINVCCGGIMGMGESRDQRIRFLMALTNQIEHPESVPINLLAKVKGTPQEHTDDLDSIEFVRTVAVARILLPKSFVRLSAGRYTMSDTMQALCFFAGANSIHHGEEKLLTTENPTVLEDRKLLNRLGMTTYDLVKLSEQECLT